MTAHPVRIQRSRAKGWKMPANTVYVGRPTTWGNPWKVGLVACGCRSAGECSHNTFRCETAAEAVAMYRTRIERGKHLAPAARELLRGKNLCCWCRLDQACHADVLLEIANAPEAAAP